MSVSPYRVKRDKFALHVVREFLKAVPLALLTAAIATTTLIWQLRVQQKFEASQSKELREFQLAQDKAREEFESKRIREDQQFQEELRVRSRRAQLLDARMKVQQEADLAIGKLLRRRLLVEDDKVRVYLYSHLIAAGDPLLSKKDLDEVLEREHANSLELQDLRIQIVAKLNEITVYFGDAIADCLGEFENMMESDEFTPQLSAEIRQRIDQGLEREQRPTQIMQGASELVNETIGFSKWGDRALKLSVAMVGANAQEMRLLWPEATKGPQISPKLELKTSFDEEKPSR